jgi:hypothetical protein
LRNPEKILQAATLMIELNGLDQRGVSAGEIASAGDNCDRVLAGFDDPRDLMLVSFAEKMMSGRKFLFQTDNPSSLIRFLEIARVLGAQVHSIEEIDGMTRALFVTASRH